jgi:hypothetical protein
MAACRFMNKMPQGRRTESITKFAQEVEGKSGDTNGTSK